LKVLEDNNILVVEVPLNCTDRLQPLDLAVNKPLKDQMKDNFINITQKKLRRESKMPKLKLAR